MAALYAFSAQTDVFAFGLVMSVSICHRIDEKSLHVTDNEERDCPKTYCVFR